METRDEDHEWSADDLSRVVRDMIIGGMRAYFELEDQEWEASKLRTLKSQGKLITGEVIPEQREIEDA